MCRSRLTGTEREYGCADYPNNTRACRYPTAMVDAVGRGQYGYSSPETTEHRPVDALRRAPMARRCALRVAAVMGCEFDVCAVGRAKQENALKFGRGTAELLLYSNISGCVLQVGQH